MSDYSRQFTFINNNHGFTISLVQGHKLIEQISHIHNIGPHALDFYKKTVLGATQLINFLKPSENIGFYIDSEDPFFRFKIEMSHNGNLRTLLLPEDFDDYPKEFTGKCRINKIMPGKSPYTSILNYNDFALEEIVNEVLLKSYQTNSVIKHSQDFKNCLMLTKLPPTNINKKIEDYEEMSIPHFTEEYSVLINDLLNKEFNTIDSLESECLKYNFKYLGSKEVKFHCPCSRERMIENLFTLSDTDVNDLFKDTDVLETRCDYCNSIYDIKQNELIRNLQ